MLTKSEFLEEIEKGNLGYFPYSTEDTFELLRSETNRYSIFKVPVEYVNSFAAFAAHAYLRYFDHSAKASSSLWLERGGDELICEHLRWIDATDTPSSIKYKSLALQGLDEYECIIKVCGLLDQSDLVVAKTKDFYVYFHWFTTG